MVALLVFYWGIYKFVRQTERGQELAGFLHVRGILSFNDLSTFFGPAERGEQRWYRARYSKTLPGTWVDAKSGLELRIDSQLVVTAVAEWDSFGIANGTVFDISGTGAGTLTAFPSRSPVYEILLFPSADMDRLTMRLTGPGMIGTPGTALFSRVKEVDANPRLSP